MKEMALSHDRHAVDRQRLLAERPPVVLVEVTLFFHPAADISVAGFDHDLKEYPIVAWRWKVENVVAKGDVTKKAGDDYAARLYITIILTKSVNAQGTIVPCGV